MNRHADTSQAFSGELGDTQTSSIPISTDEGNVFRAEVYTTVNVEQNPELGEQLFNGSLNEVTGPEGEGTYTPAVSVRYHDPDHRVFALVIPETLRHRSFELRSELLEDLSDSEAPIPDYVANFAVVFDPAELERLEDTGTGRLPRIDEGLGDDLSVPEPSEIDAATGDSSVDSEQLEREWKRVEEKKEELQRREDQLEEVRERIDRERRQMDEFEQELAAEREELERERQALEAERLNLEEQSRRMDRGEVEGADEENTQVVTDDQFIEVASKPAVEAGAALAAETPQASGVEPVPAEAAAPSSAPEPPEFDRTFDVHVDWIDLEEVPAQFDESTAGDSDGYVTVEEGRVVAACRLDDERIDALAESPPSFFVQYHDLEAYPLVALTVGALDDEGAVVESYGWPLDILSESHETILNRLCEATDLDVALYDQEGELVEALEVRAPFEENLEWIRERVEEELDDREEIGSFDEAAETFRSEDYERIGSMRHNFDREAFHQLDTASQIKLAAGVVGYWSTREQYEYLVANRTYPMAAFHQLQEDVVEAAVEAGIHLDASLRALAVDMGIATDEVELVERQLANFAEVTVQIRENDLDPLDEWENWDELIELGNNVGVTPDPDVLELAEASLKRAKDFQETHPVESASPPSEESTTEGSAEAFIEDPAAVDVEELVVSKRSETTGVTYYLPDDAVIDTFDDLADMSRADLEKLLDDPNGRLEAAQMLVERFDADVVPVVLEECEQMSAPEVTALARFLETKADGLEPELVRAVESGGPSATFVAARALAHIKSTSALPTLLEAYRDPDRQLNRPAVARTLASYGEKIVPPLVRSIKDEGVDDHVITLLSYLEDEEGGILDELSEERSESVREAAERAREQTL